MSSATGDATMEGDRSDMSVLLIENPNEEPKQLTCSEKMTDCWNSLKEKLGC